MSDSVDIPRSSEAVAATTGGDELVVRCLLIPFHGFNVLIPNTVVAEVIAYEVPNNSTDEIAWLKGEFSWRGISVPVVSLENVIGLSDGRITDQTRLIIFNSVASKSSFPFIALIAENIPRLMALKDANLHHAPDAGVAETGIYARMLLDGNAVVVPDLEAIEAMLVKAGVAEKR